nr:DUF2809 domain-containing protein [Microbacterium hydrocarbonoxydans]
MHSPSSRGPGDTARRRRLLVAAALVIAAGLLTHLMGSGPLADRAGDVLYAVMIYLVIAIAFPRASVVVLGAGALAVCALIEVSQLTGLPALWAQSFWPVRLVLGVGFDPVDLVAYAVGGGAAAVADFFTIGRRRVRR